MAKKRVKNQLLSPQQVIVTKGDRKYCVENANAV